jgi:DNA-binding transcriptional MerR regulator
MKKEFGINVISNACGVMPHTIRTWEKRYQVFTPERSEGGQRIYSEVDLDKAKLIVALIEQGHTISSIAKHSLQDLRSLLVVNKSEDSESGKMFISFEIKKLLRFIKELKKYFLEYESKPELRLDEMLIKKV